jgi:hypothetical protein
MKRILIASILSLLMYCCSAQKAERYCEVSTSFKSFNRGVNVKIDFGKDSTLFSLKDKLIKEKLSLVDNYTNVVDMLNYMSSLGWTLVNSISDESTGSTSRIYYYFKKTFDQSELEIASK